MDVPGASLTLTLEFCSTTAVRLSNVCIGMCNLLILHDCINWKCGVKVKP